MTGETGNPGRPYVPSTGRAGRFLLRFWAENISPVEVDEKASGLLMEHSAGVALALGKSSISERNLEAVRSLKSKGIEVVFWPLLSREEGYFPGELNVGAFAALVGELLDWAESGGAGPDLVAVDQELPFGQMTRLLEAKGLRRPLEALRIVYSNLDKEKFAEAAGGLRDIERGIKSRGAGTISACFPWIPFEMRSEGVVIQDMMETPVGPVDWDIISPMVYTSMLEGMSGGWISGRDADWIVYRTCLELQCARPGRAGVSLGLTGTGVLEDEPVLETPERLAAGVSAALAAGVRDISVYNLEGILARRDRLRWMRCLRDAPPRTPARSRRVDLLLAGAAALYRLTGLDRYAVTGPGVRPPGRP